MSYDLYVYRTPPGRDPEQVIEELIEAEETLTPLDLDEDPAMDRWFAEIEAVVDAFGAANRETGFLAINIPYHDSGREAQRIFDRLAALLQRACIQGGLTVFDPQEGRVINPRRDLGMMLRGNERGVRIVREVAPRNPRGGGAPPPHPPLARGQADAALVALLALVAVLVGATGPAGRSCATRCLCSCLHGLP